MHPREPGASLHKWAHTQVAVGARVACYHDEIKVSLPATWTPLHHLLLTFFHIDLQTKLEAPKPVSSVIFLSFLKMRAFYIVFLGWFTFFAGGDWICFSSIVYPCSVCSDLGYSGSVSVYSLIYEVNDILIVINCIILLLLYDRHATVIISSIFFSLGP